MRIPVLTLIIAVLLNLSVDWYIFRFLFSEFRNRIWAKIQLWSALIFALGLVSLFFVPVRDLSDAGLRSLMWIIFIYITVYVPKYIFVIFDVISRIPRLWHGRRIKTVSWTGTTSAVILFASLWWGALFNRYNIDVNRVDVEMPRLAKSFDGFKIAQISDLHVGTYGNDTAFVAKLVDEINSLHPDVIFFTGDIVNRKTAELKPFVRTLSRLNARYGVYSVLGNHDYGDYYHWDNDDSHRLNNDSLYVFQKEMGWKLLRNEYSDIVVKNDTLVVIGVENIGDPPFHVYGDLTKSYPDLSDGRPKILLSHNPAHWEKEVADSDKNIDLTLSGHTHAMQISLLGFSPAKFRYDTWGGLYTDKSDRHKLYVNIGTGTVGFPARIGATPEITLITLHPSEK